IGAVHADDRTGEQIFTQQCASCHGEKGQGAEDGYAKPLFGKRPLVELAKVIDETMPEGEPEVLSAEESAKVAAYIYDAFYSPDAQARNAPPRVELSRLTVRQYRNAVADLAASFTGRGEWDDRRGLQAEYYKGRRTRRDNRVIERVDPVVSFDFGVKSPDEQLEPHEFAIQWEGSLFAPETGEYEFVVRTEHAMRFWVNDPETPLIDAYVKSGDDTEYRAPLFLVGGRVYPLRLEFSKAKQGVDDSDKQKGPPPEVPASISLSWKRPGQTEEIIPERCLSPGRSPKVLVVEHPFPPDDRSTGFERGNTISKEWDEATTYAAIEAAQKIVDRLRDLSGAKSDDSDREAKLREFCGKFVERAFRRPLDDELKAIVIDRQFEQAPDLDTAAKRVVLLTLKSPRFLYREVATEKHDAYDVASRLAFGLWDSIPDQGLLDAAKSDRLQTREQILAESERMLSDMRSRAKLREFLHDWLGLSRFHDLAKDGEAFPNFDKAIAADLQTSLDLFLEDVAWGDSPDFRRLLLDDAFFVNGRLAQFYGVDLPADAPFQKVSFEPDRRAGVLTHPYLMTGLAYFGTTSPIHRGVFVTRSLLGRTLMPPPEAVTPLAPDVHPDLTTRERVLLQTSETNCKTCHDVVNPLGFSFEHFDAVGRFRDEEKGKPVDAAGGFIRQSGEEVTFSGARQLATALAADREVHEAFVEQLFRHVTKQPVRAFGSDRLSQLTDSFERNGFNIRRLLAEIVTSAAFGAEASNTPEQPVATAVEKREPVVARTP
ncbi:MAG: DUF1592 domain-containing protein, partial [Planctomycetota bacterium]|nr:DUF1592 domain-containing protein [Planctomycetota bacterium]